MTLRARLAVLTSVAVALAIVVSSVVLWVLIRSSLLNQVDQSLLDRLPNVGMIARTTAALSEQGSPIPGDVRLLFQGDPMGIQLIDPEGTVTHRIAADGIHPALEADELLLDEDNDGPLLRTLSIEGVSFRVMGTTLPNGGAIWMIQPLADLEATMARIAWILAGVAGIGVATAGGLGWATARAGLRPVDQLVAAAERVAATKDLGHRIDVTGEDRDEVARLAASVNSMLAALDGARTQQRELVENAGHELRTPLTALRNDLGLLLSAEQHPERTLPPEERARLLADLEAEAEALSHLVAEVIDLARGDVEPELLIETDLRLVVQRAANRTRRINPAVKVTVEGEGTEAAVRPMALERAVANLVRNAVQVSRDGQTVEVAVSEDDGWARIQVLDRGPGLAEEDMPRLFDRFYRGRGARERQGSGLGLAIVAQVAEMHGGTVEAASREGGGAVFTLSLPVR